jgi:hypothetical protein
MCPLNHILAFYPQVAIMAISFIIHSFMGTILEEADPGEMEWEK